VRESEREQQYQQQRARARGREKEREKIKKIDSETCGPVVELPKRALFVPTRLPSSKNQTMWTLGRVLWQRAFLHVSSGCSLGAAAGLFWQGSVGMALLAWLFWPGSFGKGSFASAVWMLF